MAKDFDLADWDYNPSPRYKAKRLKGGRSKRSKLQQQGAGHEETDSGGNGEDTEASGAEIAGAGT